MRFYFPDSQDQIDPSFDFESEVRSPYRIRQRDDLYAHEILDPCPYDGMLISKAIVDGVEGGAGKYSAQQRQRLASCHRPQYTGMTSVRQAGSLRPF